MRRLIVEFDLDEVARLKGLSSLKSVESMEVLTFLRSTPEEVALICRVKFKDPKMTVRKAFGDNFDELQILEQGKEGLVCYFRKRRPAAEVKAYPLSPGVFLSPPYEVSDGRVRATFLGNAKEIRGILRSFSGAVASYRVVSLMDAKFLPDSPLGRLTEKQRSAIVAAFKMGYYDVPRRASSEKVAWHLGIGEPTLVMHRRKAERRLLAQVIGETS